MYANVAQWNHWCHPWMDSPRRELISICQLPSKSCVYEGKNYFSKRFKHSNETGVPTNIPKAWTLTATIANIRPHLKDQNAINVSCALQLNNRSTKSGHPKERQMNETRQSVRQWSSLLTNVYNKICSCTISLKRIQTLLNHRSYSCFLHGTYLILF